MQEFKICSWNIEHADALVTALLTGDAAIQPRIEAIAEEIAALDADILLISEAPKGEMRAARLFDEVAPGYRLITRGASDERDYGIKGTQWMWFLVRSGAAISARLLHLDRWNELTAPRWGDQRKGNGWQVSYPMFEAGGELLRFHVPGAHSHWRHPQVLLAEFDLGNGQSQLVEVIGCHLKSKINKVHPKGDPGAADFFDSQPALVADIMTSRIKLTTEATDIRHYIEGRFQAQPDAAIIVLGDLNDGPGKERIERRFLYHDLVANLQGDVFLARQFLNHALFDFEDSARWSYDLKKDRIDPGRSPRILLDHIMFTQSLTGADGPKAAAFKARKGGGKVEHDVHHRVAAGRPRSAQTSDHRPVSMVFDRRS